jgi:glucose/arabinose dehydrogenase
MAMPRHLRAGTLALALLFATATPAPAIDLPTGFSEWTLADNLSQASGFAFLPDGRALVVRKHGIINIVPPYGYPGLVGTIPNVYTVGEAGLTGVAIDPGWPTRPYVYLFYSMASPRRNVVERWTASGQLTSASSVDFALGSPYRILDLHDEMSNHNGGCLRFDASGRLLVSHGDDVRSCVAQDPANQNGVVMRLLVAGLPPGGGGPPPRAALVDPANPFAADTSGASLVLCHGLRNPYKLTLDPLDGRLFAGDVGGNAWEEIDEVLGSGQNFGWPIWEADTLTGVVCGQGITPYVPPIVSYFHDPNDPNGPPNFFAIVAGPVYRPEGDEYDLPPAYDGVLFYADHGKGWIRAVRETPGGWVPFTAPGQPDSLNWARGYERITELAQGPDGALYLTTFIGRFVRLLPPLPVSGTPERPPDAGTHGLLAVRPNPLRPGAVARLPGISGAARVLDAGGRIVQRLPSPEWDGSLARGSRAAPGAYWIVAGSHRGRVVVVD